MIGTNRCFLIAMAALALSASLAFSQETAQEIQTTNDMKRIGLAYLNYINNNKGKAPQKVDDLAPLLENEKRCLETLKAGTLVFNYGIGVPELARDGSAKVVLIYEKDVPTKGGYVAFADISVKKMSADEYKKAITPVKK
jgi:hypothetical protein